MGVSTAWNDEKTQLSIAIDGRFDFSCHQDFRSAYEGVNPVPKTIVVDLKRTTYLDSSALGMLLLLRDYTSDSQTSIRLENVGDDVKKILTISNFNQLFTIA